MELEKPTIYTWQFNQNYLRILSLIEGIRRDAKFEPIDVHLASEVYKKDKNNCQENDFILAQVEEKNNAYKGITYFKGGNHRIIANDISGSNIQYNILKAPEIIPSFSNMINIHEDSTIYNYQNLPRNSFSYEKLLQKDTKYINILELKEYQPILERMETESKMNVQDFKELVRTHLDF